MCNLEITGTPGFGYTTNDSSSWCFGSKENQKHVKTNRHDP